MVAGASILIATDSLPEKVVAHFNTMTDVTMDTNYRVIKQPKVSEEWLIVDLTGLMQQIGEIPKEPHVADSTTSH